MDQLEILRCAEEIMGIAKTGGRRQGIIGTFLISCFIFNPAPYQAPVIVVAVTPTVRIIVRALGALDMVLGALSITWFDVGKGMMSPAKRNLPQPYLCEISELAEGSAVACSLRVR